MNKHLLSSFVLIVATLFPLSISAQQTEISVLKGKVLAQNDKGNVEAAAGQRAILGGDQKPVVTPDNQMISDLMELDKLLEQEKQDSKIRIDGASIQITSINSDNEWTFLNLSEMNATTTTVRMGPTSLGKDENFYEMNGREIPFDRKEISPGKGYYFLHFNTMPQAGKYKFIIVENMEPQRGWLAKNENLWQLQLANDTQYYLNYFKVVLPPSAIFVQSKPAACAVEQMGGRLAVTIRKYTGKEADGAYSVTFMWPGRDGTTMKDLPAGLRGVYDQLDEKQAKQMEEQVLPLMRQYLQACRDRNVALAMKFNPYMNQDALEKTPEVFDLVGKATVDSVKLNNEARYSEFRPVIRASGGDWSWYWRQTPNGWQIFSQECTGETEKTITRAIKHKKK